MSKLSALEARIEAAERDGASPAELLTYRQQCLAYVQLALRDDPYQMCRASIKLAMAHIAVGSSEAALGHAHQAQDLLQGAQPSLARSPLVLDVLQTLAVALAGCGKTAEATSYFKEALAMSNKIHGADHLDACPILREWAKMAVAKTKDYSLAERLLQQEIDIRKSLMVQDSPQERSGMDEEVLTLVQWRARLMLLHAHELQSASARDALVGGADGDDTSRELKDSRALQLRKGVLQVLEAELPQAEADSAKGDAAVTDDDEPFLDDGTGPEIHGYKPGEANYAFLARHERDLARQKKKDERVEKPEKPKRTSRPSEAEAASSKAEAELLLLASETCGELGKWQQAESMMLRVVPFFELTYGMSEQRTVALWLNIVAMRFKLQQYRAAAEALEHIVNMQKVLHGKFGAPLIPTLEKLCKAYTLLSERQPAIAALVEAHDISSHRKGASHAETLRIADVIRSLEQHV